jgi:hypothetical protein
MAIKAGVIGRSTNKCDEYENFTVKLGWSATVFHFLLAGSVQA